MLELQSIEPTESSSFFNGALNFVKERPVDAAIIAAGAAALGFVAYKGYEHLTKGDRKVSKKAKPAATENTKEEVKTASTTTNSTSTSETTKSDTVEESTPTKEVETTGDSDMTSTEVPDVIILQSSAEQALDELEVLKKEVDDDLKTSVDTVTLTEVEDAVKDIVRIMNIKTPDDTDKTMSAYCYIILQTSLTQGLKKGELKNIIFKQTKNNYKIYNRIELELKKLDKELS